ncbi:MAG: hypothetical protein H0X61_04290 [Acidimicrobiia bacterium]|nr:hypothetical protein [Acidimicrobiia bacterium]
MKANLDANNGLVFSQAVLLALVHAGLRRDDAYQIVQRAALTAGTDGRPFREVLEQELGENPVDDAALDSAFDLARSIEHRDRVFAELDRLTGSLDAQPS